MVCREGGGGAWAAAQLADYLAQVRGRPVLRSVDGGAAGAGRQVIRIDCSGAHGLSDEGYRFVVGDGGATLHLQAGGPLGAGFGVFAFLREACGCCFAGPSPDGEHIPRQAAIRFAPSDLPREPVLAYRGLQFTTLEPLQRQTQRMDWMLKNGLNFAMVRFEPDCDAADEVDPQTGQRYAAAQGSEGPRMGERYLVGEFLPRLVERGIKIDCSHHNLRCWLPPRRFAAEHPQWFALHDGQRGRDLRQLCICTSNAQAIDALVRRIDAFLHENPHVTQVGVIPEDGMGMCECAACRAMDDLPDDAQRPWLGPLHPQAVNFSKSRRYALLLNAVAAGLGRRHRQVTIVGAAYVDLAYPPIDVELAANIVMWLAIYWRDGARPLWRAGDSPINRRFRGLIEQWSRLLPGRVYLYEYYMGMNAQHSLPYPMSRVILADWRELAGLTRGASVQCLTSVHDAYGLNLLAFARAGWSREVDHDAVLRDYLQGMFGAAADALKPIYQAWVDAVDRIAVDGGAAGSPWLDQGALKPDARNIVYLMSSLPRPWLAQQMAAARAASRQPRERRQIDRLEHYLSYCHAAAALVQRVEERDSSVDEVEAALANVLGHIGVPRAEGWIAPAHALRWQRLARPRRVKEMSR